MHYRSIAAARFQAGPDEQRSDRHRCDAEHQDHETDGKEFAWRAAGLDEDHPAEYDGAKSGRHQDQQTQDEQRDAYERPAERALRTRLRHGLSATPNLERGIDECCADGSRYATGQQHSKQGADIRSPQSFDEARQSEDGRAEA